MDRDEFERRLAENRARRPVLEDRRTAGYRLFDLDDVLLYVGISVDPRKRFRGHRYGNKRSKPKEWWPRVASTRIEWFDSRPQAESAESFAVVTEYPRHNKAKTGEASARRFRHRWLEERLAGGPVRGRTRARRRGRRGTSPPPRSAATRCRSSCGGARTGRAAA
ncbi:GIY-YIG nuclease family protein [Embleya scabrispora]|uniref:GIY-YIG nuclease family protein n=1 Tax=Embleya scabrispora TaxID=159449 RepID=UPI003CCB9A30